MRGVPDFNLSRCVCGEFRELSAPNGRFSDDLVHLARLALSGRSQDIQLYLQRLARRYQRLAPSLSSALTDLLRDLPTRQSPLRGGAVAAVPVDRDTRLQLVRVEAVPAFDHEPIWSTDVANLLTQILQEHRLTQELAKSGLSPVRTAIFTGPPGVGKTLAARWLASQLNVPLLILDLSAVMSSYLGRTGGNLRHVLDYAKGVNGILFLDELDSIAKRRDDSQEVGELKRLVTALLQEIDDWPAGRLLLAATNHAELLDRAVWRRFELHLEFPLPNPESLREAVRLFVGSDDSSVTPVLIDALSECFVGSSFSDVERALESLRKRAFLQHEPLEVALKAEVEKRITELPKERKRHLATSLLDLGYSQREVGRLTGVSRDTIRKDVALEKAS